MLKSIDIHSIDGNFFKKIAKQYMLITTEANGRTNAMTASWGAVGEIWGRPASFVFIRPQRFTYELIEKTSKYSLCFMPESLKSVHGVMGTKSGRDIDKIKETDLTVSHYNETPYFEQSELVLFCEKLFITDLTENGFIDKSILPEFYPQNDLHRMYVGEVTSALAT